MSINHTNKADYVSKTHNLPWIFYLSGTSNSNLRKGKLLIQLFPCRDESRCNEAVPQKALCKTVREYSEILKRNVAGYNKGKCISTNFVGNHAQALGY